MVPSLPPFEMADPYAELWKSLPPNAQVNRVQNGYEFRILLSPAEAPTVVYGAMAAVEHLKETALLPGGPKPDLRYAQALPRLTSESRQRLALEMGLKEAQNSAQNQVAKDESTSFPKF